MANGGHRGGVGQARALPHAGQLGVRWAPGPRLACNVGLGVRARGQGKASARASGGHSGHDFAFEIR